MRKKVKLDNTSSLPTGFEPLEPFVSEWVLSDVEARMAKRQSSTIEDIRRFYDVMLPLGKQALAHLRGYQLDALPPETERLLKLMLALAEVAPAVEWYNDPKVYDGFDVRRIRFVRKIPDTAMQR